MALSKKVTRNAAKQLRAGKTKAERAVAGRALGDVRKSRMCKKK